MRVGSTYRKTCPRSATSHGPALPPRVYLSRDSDLTSAVFSQQSAVMLAVSVPMETRRSPKSPRRQWRSVRGDRAGASIFRDARGLVAVPPRSRRPPGLSAGSLRSTEGSGPSQRSDRQADRQRQAPPPQPAAGSSSRHEGGSWTGLPSPRPRPMLFMRCPRPRPTLFMREARREQLGHWTEAVIKGAAKFTGVADAQPVGFFRDGQTKGTMPPRRPCRGRFGHDPPASLGTLDHVRFVLSCRNRPSHPQTHDG